ncbi:membrane protein [Skermanella stibiiresistens SB22]|uniref:Membrane protein n=1 Tax=Skermanella stibiiresistens SB22 TaxID=1385369 RepID=W9HDI9_9PROT|nr:FixH family protein [Skermanella stibiiresistens]EWY42757.1 membrane protein [Skermanella stibiiresistens SB22]
MSTVTNLDQRHAQTLGAATGSSPQRAPERKRAPGWWYPWIFVAFFLVTVGVNGTMAYFAMSTWTGLETQHYWQRGTAYNVAIEGARHQRERGWKVGIDFQATTLADAGVTVELRDREGTALTGAHVTAELVRPTSEGHDFTVDLTHLGQGRYTASFALPLPGQWDLRITADHPKGDYQEVRRVVVKG